MSEKSRVKRPNNGPTSVASQFQNSIQQQRPKKTHGNTLYSVLLDPPKPIIFKPIFRGDFDFKKYYVNNKSNFCVRAIGKGHVTIIETIICTRVVEKSSKTHLVIKNGQHAWWAKVDACCFC